MSQRPGVRGLALAAVATSLSVSVVSGQAGGALVERLDAYLQRYETQLRAVVADEVFDQRTRPLVSAEGAFGGGRGNPALHLTLRLESEMAFLRLPGDREWLGQRRVRAVNRKAVPAEPALTQLLAGDDQSVEHALSIVRDSSRYHLGTPRTVNVPTLPLDLAHPRRRAAFDVNVRGTGRLGGRAVTRIELEERGPGGIVQMGDLGYWHAVVTLWASADGSVHRGVVRLRSPGIAPAELDVTFALDAGVGILVPVRMRETFHVDRGEGDGTATYRNFRRFEVSARLVPGR